MDWSPETGISEESYKPESFDLPALVALTKALAKNAGEGYPLDVTLRGAVMYKRNRAARYHPYPRARPR
jgi:hypothetical protein